MTPSVMGQLFWRLLGKGTDLDTVWKEKIVAKGRNKSAFGRNEPWVTQVMGLYLEHCARWWPSHERFPTENRGGETAAIPHNTL